MGAPNSVAELSFAMSKSLDDFAATRRRPSDGSRPPAAGCAMPVPIDLGSLAVVGHRYSVGRFYGLLDLSRRCFVTAESQVRHYSIEASCGVGEDVSTLLVGQILQSGEHAPVGERANPPARR